MVEIDNNYNTVHVNSAGKNTIAEIVTVKQEDTKIPVIILNPTHVIGKIRQGDIASISPIEIIKEINNEEQLINFIKEESLIHNHYIQSTLTKLTLNGNHVNALNLQINN